ncbi:co-chaperone GroES [Candidatus Woesearchaeota archaeon]|nr:co-chaperone GroES [Candidatus Woesearchaeota archaeon]
MSIKPLKDRVLIKPKETEEKTAGGIYIPDSAKEKTQEAEVIAVGTDEKMPVKTGDKVIYESYAGTEVKINGKKHLIIQVKDILAKLE